MMLFMKKVMILFAILVFLPFIAYAGPVAEITGTLTGGGLSGSITTICGDGVISGSEQCDGSNLNGQTCLSLGYASGTLSCTNSCTFDNSNCKSSGGGGYFVGGGGYYIAPKKCPTCASPTNWSDCVNNQKMRTIYYCNSTTNYTCKSYNEIQDCEIFQPPPSQPTPQPTPQLPETPLITATVAEVAIEDANQTIKTSKNEGKNTTYAENLLSQAQNTYNNGEYASAKTLADQAKTAAETAEIIKSGFPQIEIKWIILLIVLFGIFVSSIIIIPRSMYKKLEYADFLSVKHIGNKIVLKCYLDPIKRYSTGDVVYRIAHEVKPSTMYEKLIAIGRGLTILPDVKYSVYGKIHKLSEEDIYMKINKIKPLI